MINRHQLYALLAHELWKESFGPCPAYGQLMDYGFAVASVDITEETIEKFKVARQLEAVWKKGYDPKKPVPEELILADLAKGEVIQQDMANWCLPSDPEILGCFEEARSLCHSVLPPLGDIWSELWSRCGFGPGAVFHRSGKLSTTILDKIAGKSFGTTPLSRELVADVLQNFYPNWAEFLRKHEGAKLHTVRGNKLSFVHKDESKCRGIAVEPSMNMFLQKGVGNYLLEVLRQRCGIDLIDGQEVHRELAREASREARFKEGNWRHDLATIDLSDASDRIPTELVRYLLPGDWFALLCALRAPHSRRPDGTWRVNHSFSTQGNGFTFPLETLVFYALVASCNGHRTTSVYGDDIICHSEKYFEVCKVLEAAGAVVNVKKSYGPGSLFRESCGGDFLGGVNVRPVFYKADAQCYSDVATLHNRLFEVWGVKVSATLKYLESLVPKDKRLYGPRSYTTSASKFGMLANTTATPYSSYFWSPTGYQVQYDKATQSFVALIKEWGYSTTPIPEHALEAYDEEGQLLAFLYAGSEFSESPFARPVVRSRKVPARDL